MRRMCTFLREMCLNCAPACSVGCLLQVRLPSMIYRHSIQVVIVDSIAAIFRAEAWGLTPAVTVSRQVDTQRCTLFVHANV